MTAGLFLWPWWWPAVALLPLLFWVHERLVARRLRQQRALFGRRHGALCGEPARPRLRRWLAGLCLALCGAALLQPVAGRAPGEAAGPDVFLCLDVSRSMAARDLEPTRLAVAQREIRRLCERAAGARIGLCVFAGEARLWTPLSADLGSVATLAGIADHGAVSRGGTDLGAAIALAEAALRRSGSAAGSVLVLTDGEDFGGRGIAAAATARAAGLVVHCIGLGSEGGSKIVVDGEDGETFLRDGSGAEVVSALDGPSLAAVAEAGGGRFVRWAGDGDVATLYASDLVERAEAVHRRDPRLEQAHRFQWPLLAALLLWMLLWCLPERRRCA